MGLTHISINLCLRNQGCYGVHDHDIDCAGTHHGLGDLQCLLAVIRLGDVQVININTDISRVNRV